MYSVKSFGDMIADRVRVSAYTEALRRSIVPGSVVVEVGSGTGFFTLMACRLGAGRVYAIEANPAISIAQAAAADNGYADRISFIRQLSTQVELPERADVLLSDLRGVLPLHTQHIPSIVDARRRFLKPGGVQIPGCDRLWAGLIGNGKAYQARLRPWDQGLDGWNWAAARSVTLNGWWRQQFDAEDLLSDGELLFTLDYRTIENPQVFSSVTLRPRTAGTAYGVAVWFTAELLDGVGFSTAPGETDTVYGPVFFPFESPLSLVETDVVTVDVFGNLTSAEYIWSWKTKVNGKFQFSQSEFKGGLSLEGSIRNSAGGFRPTVGAEGQIVRWILEKMDGELTNQQLASGLRERFPAQFSSEQAALDRVVDAVRAFGGDPAPGEK